MPTSTGPGCRQRAVNRWHGSGVTVEVLAAHRDGSYDVRVTR